MRDLRCSLAATETLAGDASAAAVGAAGSFTFDEQEHLASGAFAAELRADAAPGAVVVESDDRLLCYPSRIRVLPGDGLDLTRLAEGPRPPLDQRSGVYYTKAGVLDAYELLRQFIVATDDLAGTLVVAVIPAELVTDETRGLPAYSALALRVADEVRDRRRPNPFASLVRLEVRLEAV